MKITLLAFVFFLSTSWIMAQTSANQRASEQIVTGCLKQSNGEYMLTSREGMTYKLTRDAANLSGYVGQQVRVTGMVVARSATNRTQEAGGIGGTFETLRVSSVKHISNICPSGEGEMPN
jgi:hypothetical protein